MSKNQKPPFNRLYPVMIFLLVGFHLAPLPARAHNAQSHFTSGDLQPAPTPTAEPGERHAPWGEPPHEDSSFEQRSWESQPAPGELPATAGGLSAVNSAAPSFPSDAKPVLTWSGFYSGPESDVAYDAVYDASGNLFVTGRSTASWGSPVHAHSGGENAFVAKLNHSGALQWLTFLGGPGQARGYAIDLDASGNIYVAGIAWSAWGTNPTNPYSGGEDAFVAKLNGSGTLLKHTFLGSSALDHGEGLDVIGGDIYLAGDSHASWGAPLSPYQGMDDGFLAKLDTATLGLTWHLFYGSIYSDFGFGVAADGLGNVYATGNSNNPWGSPCVDWCRPWQGGNDGFIIKVSASGVPAWLTFLGSSQADELLDIAIDGSGNVFVIGDSQAGWGLPKVAHAGGQDVFAARVNANGGLVWLTFMGSTGNEYARVLAPDGSSNLFVSGASSAAWGAPLQPYRGGNGYFLAKLNSNGDRLWNTFIDPEIQMIWGGAICNSGQISLVGYADEGWSSPVRAFRGGLDGLVVSFSSSGSRVWHTFLGGAFNSAANTIAGVLQYNLYLGGYYTPGSGQDSLSVNLYGYVPTAHQFFASISPGPGVDSDVAFVVDGTNNFYAGGTVSAGSGGVRPYSGGTDGFVYKMYGWYTYLGSAGMDEIYDIAVDTSGNVYVAGKSDASWGSPLVGHNGGQDAFLAKLSSSGALLWNMFLGSASDDEGRGVAIGGNGAVYITGTSNAAWGSPCNFWCSAHNGGADVFLVRTNTSGATTSPDAWLTFMGSSGNDYARDIAADSSGNSYLVGTSFSSWGSPLVGHASGSDAFAAKYLSAPGLGFRQWNTFLGSSGNDEADELALSSNGDIFLVGTAAGSFGAPQFPHRGGKDAFIARLNGSGARQWLGFFGSAQDDFGRGIYLGNNALYFTGTSYAPWGPVANPFGGDYCMFAAALLPYGTYLPFVVH